MPTLGSITPGSTLPAGADLLTSQPDPTNAAKRIFGRVLASAVGGSGGGNPNQITGTLGLNAVAAIGYVDVTVTMTGAMAGSIAQDTHYTASGVQGRLLNDAYTHATPWYSLVRSGETATSYTLTAQTINLVGVVQVNGVAIGTGGGGAQGPAGAAGAQGIQGIQGIQGPAGAASTVAGPTGPAGLAGAASTVAGPQGPAGNPGATGATGAAGAGASLATLSAPGTVQPDGVTTTIINGKLTVPTSAPTAATVVPAPAAAKFLQADGTYLTGVQAGAAILPTIVPVTTNTSVSGPVTLSPPASGSNAYNLTLTGATILSLSGGAAGQQQTMTVYLRQDATAGRVVTLPSGVRWPGSTAPTPGSAAGGIDVFVFTTPDAGTTWFGSY